jgi:hypothetical protein
MQMIKINDIGTVGKKYLTTSFFRAMFFAWPVTQGFLLGKITIAQIGIYFAVISATSLLLEVPTGAWADGLCQAKICCCAS